MKDGTRDCIDECKSYNINAFMDNPRVRSAPDRISVSFSKTVQIRHLDEDDDFSDEEDLTFDEYINVDGKEDTDTVMVNTSLNFFYKEQPREYS